MARSRIRDEFTLPTGTVIGKGFTIEAARFTCSDAEAMRIDGTIVGNVEIDGVLNISDSGHVEGHINASSVRVAGRVTGNIRCSNALHLASTADVKGNVLTTTLIVDDGAVMRGRCQTNLSVDSKMVGLTYSDVPQ